MSEVKKPVNGNGSMAECMVIIEFLSLFPGKDYLILVP